MLAQLDIGLQRDAPAFLFGGSGQVLRDPAGQVAVYAGAGQGQSSGVGRGRADNFSAAIILCLAPVAAQRERYGVAQIGLDHPAHAIMFEAIDLVARGDVADVAVIIAVESRDARTDIFAQRQVDRGTTAIFFLGIIAGFDLGLKIIGRALGDDADDTGRGVLAEQRPLRSAQHFNALNVEQVGKAFARAAQHHAVEHGGHRRLGSDREVDGAHTAQEQRLVERCARFAEIEGGDEILRIFQRQSTARGNGIAANHRNGKRDILQIFLTLLRGDNDGVLGIFLFASSLVLREGRRRKADGERRSSVERGARDAVGGLHDDLLPCVWPCGFPLGQIGNAKRRRGDLPALSAEDVP